MRAELDSFYDFVAIGELADTTKQVIALNLAYAEYEGRHRRGVDQVEQMVLQQARDYLGRVREGFVLSVRSTDVNDRAELRYLLERVLLDWRSLHEELGLAVEETSAGEQPADRFRTVERVRGQLLAFGMAAVALGALPRLPQEEITFPKSYSELHTYADIPVPHTPGEMLYRIEELEQMLWQIAVHDLADLVQRRYNSLRRTYGFFESSAYLARQESRRMGVKATQRLL